ncbi:MAG: TonB-dependent receptor domain-containing protein, partial [Bacteroidota bacterium]
RGDIPADGMLSGFIADTAADQSLEYVTISLYSQRDSSLVTGTITDIEGKFIIEQIPYGRFFLEASFIGYKTLRVNNITVKPDNKTINMGSLPLQSDVTSLEEVEVVGERPAVEFKIDKKVVNVAKDVTASGGTAVDALERVPSIQTDIDGNVSIRGSSNFKVLIDGKPSVLQGSEALQQIPASAIENIEIITNPSAKYDPDGLAGIINIIMKKQKGAGITGLINATAGTQENFSGDFLINIRKENINFFVGGEGSVRQHPGSVESYRESTIRDTTFYQQYDGDASRGHSGYGFKAGADYYLNDRNTITFQGNFGERGFGRGSTAKYYEYTSPATVEEYWIRENDFDIRRKYYSGNINWQHKFNTEGHEFQAYGYFSTGIGDEKETLDEIFTDMHYNRIDSIPLGNDRSGEESEEQEYRFTFDYTLPFNDAGKFEAGYQIRYDLGNADYVFEEFDPDTRAWYINNELSNEVEFTRNIQSMYSTLSNEAGKFGYQLGMRVEYTDRIIAQITTDEEYRIHRWDYFPTIHTSYQLPAEQQLQASYSRRINRPREWFLNPFPSYSDPNNVRIGNPELGPEYVDSYEFNYMKRFKQSFVTAELFYRQTNDGIERLSTLRDDNVMVHTFTNSDKQYATGLELMGNLFPVKWWNLNVSASIYNYEISGEVDDVQVKKNTNSWDARFMSTFMINKTNSRIQISGFYRAPSVTLQGERDGFFVTGIGIRQDFWKRKASLTLQSRDIFNTMRFSFTSESDNFYTKTSFSREPVISLNFTYRINNYKAPRNNRGGGGAETVEMDFNGGGMGM